MSGTQPRRFVTAERSSQKDTHRASYEPLTLSMHSQTMISPEIPRYGSSTHLLVPTSHRMRYGQAPRSPTSAEIKSREQHLKSTLAKKRNQGVVSNLKSELQNLKLQVSRIMNKQGDYSKTYSSRGSGVHSACQEYEPGETMLLGKYGKQVQDSVSVTSQKVIDEPLRKLELQYGVENYDHAHYLELENDLLKTELRNLKNKYNATKQELRQKCQALEKKNEYLEVSLRRSEESLKQCRRNLEVEMQTIKFQLSRRVQQQAEQDQIRNSKISFPIPERDSSSGGNELLQDKMKKLYEELNEKSRAINNMNIQFNDIKGEYENKSYELKKQIELNGELQKQLQFARRQNSRNKNLLEQEIAKRMQLNKNVEFLREKVSELTKQVQLKDQIVKNSEQIQNKLSAELQNYKEHEHGLSNDNYQLQNELRKLRQLNQTNEEEIKQLKQTVNNFTAQIQQLLKNLRTQKERGMEIEQNYRRMIDQIKEKAERQLEEVKNEFQRYRQLSTQTNFEKEETLKERVDTDIKEKDRQINKWKAQYKMLKIKFEEHAALQNSKKQEIQTYYRNYKEYKTKNKVLEMRNKVLEESASDYIEKMQKIQAANLQERAQFIETINSLNMHCQQLERKAQSLQIQLKQTFDSLNNQNERANQEQAYRKQLEKKVLTLDIEENEELMQVIEKIKKRVVEQDDKVNKYIKQIKTKDVLLNKLRQQIRDVMQSQQKELQNFRTKQIGDVIHQMQSKAFSSLDQLKSQSQKEIQIELNNNNELLTENAKFKGQIAELTKQLMQLRQEAKSISHLYNLKSAEIEQIRDKNKQEINNLEQKFEELEKTKINLINSLQTELNTKNQQIQAQRNQIRLVNTGMINFTRETFDEALKNQIETSKKLRDELNKKNEQVYRIRDSFALLKAEYDNLKSESDINRLKFITEKKNIQVQYDVESQQFRNQLHIEQKKVTSLQQKIKLVIDENRKKDNFIQTYVMGKKLPTGQKQFVIAFLKEYEICVTGKNITERLQTESQELQKLTLYNFNLMKEIAEMKERMLLYEAAENSELSKSITDYETPSRKIESPTANHPINQYTN